MHAIRFSPCPGRDHPAYGVWPRNHVFADDHVAYCSCDDDDDTVPQRPHGCHAVGVFIMVPPVFLDVGCVTFPSLID